MALVPFSGKLDEVGAGLVPFAGQLDGDPTQEIAQPQRSATGEIANQFKAGIVSDLPKMAGQAMQFASDPGQTTYERGKVLADWATEQSKRPDLQPQEDQHNVVTNALASGARMIPQSVVPLAIVGAGLAAAPIGATATLAGSAILGSIPAAMSQGQETLDKGLAAGLTRDKAIEAARINAAIEGGGETLGTYAGGKLFGIGAKAVSKVAKAGASGGAGKALQEIASPATLKPWLKQLPETALVETGTEIGQNAGEAAIENAYGIDNKSPYEAGKEAIAPTLGMTALLAPFGLAGFASNAHYARRRAEILASPDAPQEIRAKISEDYYMQLAKVDQDAADAFKANASRAIVTGQRMTIDESLFAPAAPSPITAAAMAGVQSGAIEQKRQEQAIAAAAATTSGATNETQPAAKEGQGASVTPGLATSTGAIQATGLAGSATGNVGQPATESVLANGNGNAPDSRNGAIATEAPGGIAPEQQQSIAAPQITPAAPALSVTPAAPIANDQQAEQPGALKSQTTFKTGKGSSYVFHDDGTTTRDKAPRPEHPGEGAPTTNQGPQDGNQAQVSKPAAPGQPTQPAASAGQGVAPALQYPQQPTTGGVAIAQQPAPMSLGEYGKAKEPAVTSQSPVPATKSPGKPVDLSRVSEDRLNKLTESKFPMAKAAAKAELARRKEMSAGNVGDTLPNSGSEKPKSDALVRVRTVYGEQVRVRQSDLDGTRTLIPTFSASGEKLIGKSIHRENLDPDGSKQKELNQQGIQDIIGADHDRKAFATEAAAKRAAEKHGVTDTHAVVPASEVSPGAAGFVLRKKSAAPVATNETAPDAPQSIRKGLKSVAQRQVNAADKFISSVVEQFGLSEEDATKAWNYYLKNKLVSVDSVGGQFNLNDGRLWNGDSMKEAARLADEKSPGEQRKADLENRKSELLAKRKQLADASGGLAAERPDTAGAAAKVDEAAGRMKATAAQSVADRRAKLDALRGRFVAGMESRRQQAEAQHIEDKTTEPATAPVIAESIAKGARNTGTDLRKEHAALLAEIDAAIAKAPAEATDTVTFDVPGDGKFKVANSKPRLEWFRAKIAAAKKGFSPEAKRAAHKTPMQKIEGGMASDETIREMLKDGDLTAALELSKVVGRPLVFGARSDGGTPIIFTDAKPFIAAGLEKFGMASGRSFVLGQKAVAAWTVTDIGSGLSIASGDTRAKAEAAAKELLSSVSQKDFQEASKKSGMAKDQSTLEAEWVKWAEQAEYDKDHAAENERKASEAKEDVLSADLAKWAEFTGEEPDFSPYARNPFDPVSMNPVATLEDYEKARKNGKGDEFLDHAESKLDEDIAGHRPTLEAIRRIRSGNVGNWRYVGDHGAGGIQRHEKTVRTSDGREIRATIDEDLSAYGMVREDGVIKKQIGKDGETLTFQQAREQADREVDALMNPKADPKKQKLTTDIPASVRNNVQRALTKLRDIEQMLDGVERARGKGRILSIEVRDQQEAINAAKKNLDEFRKMAPENNVDADAVVSEMGGEPDLSRFGAPAADEKAEAQTPEPATQIIKDVAKARPFDAAKDVRDEAIKSVEAQTGKGFSEHPELTGTMMTDPVYQAIHDGQYEGIRAYAAALPVGITESAIPRETANRAFSGTSMSPERRGESARRGYVREMVDLWRRFEKAYNASADDRKDRFVEAFADIADRYAGLTNAYLSSHSRVMSTMITGPGNFPSERNRKLSDAADNKAKSASDYLQKAPAKLLRALRGAVDNSVSSAITEAETKLAERQADQLRMKAVNLAHGRFLKDPASLDKSDMTDAEKNIIREYKPRYSWEPHPFAPYELTNNGSEIRRLAARVEELKRRANDAEAQAPEDDAQQADESPVRMVRNADAGRLQLFFDGKPSEEIRTDLKASGFKWAPSVSAWQRQLTDNAVAAAEQIIAKHFPSEHAEPESGDSARYNVATDTHATHADKAIYGMAVEGKTAAEILSFISKTSRRPFNRYLANALRKLGVESTIKVDSMGAWNITGNRSAAKYAAAYNPKTDTVALFTARDAERHALHELTHAATLKAIAAGGQASVQMRALFLSLKRSGALDGQYGMSNLDEFVAEAFSNPKFQQALKEIPAPKGSTLKNAWQWFVRAVARALGIRTAAMETALDRAMTVGANLMRENAALTGDAQGGNRYALAWHGTPHLWAPEPGFPHGRPRLDKMGTGEGAQAYGWGWYSAQERGVASTYKEMLTPDNRGVDFNALIVRRPDGFHVINRVTKEHHGGPFASRGEAVDSLGEKNEGAIYQLDIPDDVMPTLLDWDKPLRDQPAAVRAALSKAGMKGDSLSNAIKIVAGMGDTGASIYKFLATRDGEYSEKKASELMKKIGIPGLRYLDGQSRDAGRGTHNYVIWDQPTLDRISLLERNGEKLDAIREADAVRYSADGMPDTITVDGIERPTTNSNGKPIAQDDRLDVVPSGQPSMLEGRMDRLRSDAELLRNIFEKNSQGNPLRFRSDIPNERWLQEKVIYAESKGRDRYGVPYMGTVTGRFSGPVIVPTRILAKLKGEKGEQSAVREKDLQSLISIMRETGKLPLNSRGEEDAPYVEVAYDGSAWVSEGNHRIMAAQAVGMDDLPVEIRYFDGGERVGFLRVGNREFGAMSPKRFSNQIADDIRYSKAEQLPDTITINGVERSRLNSNGKPIAQDEAGVRRFWEWFGSSAVVDDQGRPMVMYHGTTSDFSVFDLEGVENQAEDTGLGFFFADRKQEAEYFTKIQEDLLGSRGDKTSFGASILPVYLAIRKPKAYATQGKMFAALSDSPYSREGPGVALYEQLSAKGFDGVVVNDSRLDGEGSGRWFVAFEPEQIKSAIGNNGQFSPTNPDIRYNVATDWYDNNAPASVKNIVTNAMHSDANTSWLTPFNTQYHKAEKWAAEGKTGFKRLFDLTQRFISDVYRFAILAQNEAPTLFHEVKSIGDVKKYLKSGDLTGSKHKADIDAIAAPLYEGTLYGGGSPLSGVIFDAGRLREEYKLTDRQIRLYHEALAAAGVSMDELVKSIIAGHAKTNKVKFDREMTVKAMADDVVRRLIDVKADMKTLLNDSEQPRVDAEAAYLREQGLDDEADALLKKFEKDQKEATKGVARIDKTIKDIRGAVTKNTALQEHGYFPLMRFGKNVVKATSGEGKDQVTEFRGHYEGIPLVPRSGQYEANKVAAAIRAEHPDWTVTTEIDNDEKHKLYAGLNMEAMRLFAEHMDADMREPLQEYFREAVGERSVLKRLIHRKGTPGFDRDVRRTLAQFITSNARHASSSYHMADMTAAAEAANEDGGDIGKEAVRLLKYVQNPQDEAQNLRGFLFFNFLGGSIASAMVNMTQVPMMTFPYLTRYESAAALAKRLALAGKMAVKNPGSIGGTLGAALQQAELDGVTAPQEIHQLISTAANNIFAGNRLANGFLRAWGAPFAMAESFNRRATFIASYQIAERMTPGELAATGTATAFEFAEKAVKDTQGIYNKGNRMNVGRGAIGGTLMTFKQYNIMYLELLKRMPRQQQLIMLGLLALSAGAGGLPFVEDLEDIIDTIGQWLGYGTNSKKWVRNTAESVLGRTGADVALNGVMNQMGISLHSRFGMENLIPGTAILKESSIDRTRDIAEFFGPAASVLQNAGKALQALATGHPGRAAMAMAPNAVSNAVKGIGMADTGYAEDSKGRRTVPVNAGEAFFKGIGFNPKSVADLGAIKGDILQDQHMVQVKREEFTSAITDAILSGDAEARQQALADMRQWNDDNPKLRVVLTPGAVLKRVRDAKLEGVQRFLKTVPKTMRSDARSELVQ